MPMNFISIFRTSSHLISLLRLPIRHFQLCYHILKSNQSKTYLSYARAMNTDLLLYFNVFSMTHPTTFSLAESVGTYFEIRTEPFHHLCCDDPCPSSIIVHLDINISQRDSSKCQVRSSYFSNRVLRLLSHSE